MMRYYLDTNATSPVHPLVLEALFPYLEKEFGNPSSAHAIGRTSQKALVSARKKIASIFNVSPTEIIFTASGTEANNHALKGTFFYSGNRHIITTTVEHTSILNSCAFLESLGAQVTYVPVDEFGIPDIDYLKRAIRKDTALISVIYANNETGTLSPIEEIGSIARSHRIPFHVDGVQAIGKVPIDFAKSSIDFLSCSGHKIGAPKGIGFLIARRPLVTFIHGGNQEAGRRGSTENVAFCVGLAKAVECVTQSFDESRNKILTTRDRLEHLLLSTFPDATLNGHLTERLPNTINISFPGIDGYALMLALDEVGICVSTGSACASKAPTLSHVLKAMGLSQDRIRSSIRISIGTPYSKEQCNEIIYRFQESITLIQRSQ